MFDDRVSLHVHKQLLSVPSVLHRSSSLLVFGSGEAVLFQKMRNSALYRIIVKTHIGGNTCQWQESVVINDEKWQGNSQKRLKFFAEFQNGYDEALFTEIT